MTVRQGGAIKIDVEATTDQYVRAMGNAAKATDKHAKAVERDEKALKKARVEYQVQAARAQNLADKLKKVDAASAQRVKHLKREAETAKATGTSYAGLARKIGMVGGVAGAAVLGLGALASKTADLAQESLQLQNVFDNIPFSLKRARDETRGLADDETLARNAIMAHQSGIATTSEAYAKLVGQAQTLALKMGRDVNETIERVTQGLAKQEREILDELVILPRMEDMWKRAAEAAGKTTDQLTDQEKNSIFLQEAQKALAEATKGVGVDMDGAAGAIARATVEMKNMKTAALGGEEQSLTLREGMRELDAQTLKLAANYAQYGDNVRTVRQALRDVGVDTSKLEGTQGQLERQMRKLIEAEAFQIVQRAENNELTEEQIERAEDLLATGAAELKSLPKLVEMNKLRLGLTQEQVEATAAQAEEDAEILALKREALTETETEIAFLRARGGEESEINALVVEQLELKADILEADGELEKAAKARRDAELAAARAEGAAIKRRRGGGGRGGRDKRFQERIERDNFLAQQEFERRELGFTLQHAIDARRKAQAEFESLDPFSEVNLERQLANVIDFEDRRAEVELSSRMRSIEAQRAAGVEPLQLIDEEAEARLAHVEAVRGVEERRLEREILLAEEQGRMSDARLLRAEQEISAVEYLGQVEDIEHQQAMARMAERQKRERFVLQEKMRLTKMGADVTLNAAAAVARATILEGQSLRKSVAGVAKSLAFEHTLKAASEGVNAAIAAASYRYDAAAQHTANAAASAAVAATAGSIAAAAGVGGAGGAGSSGGGFASASAFGPGAGGAPAGGTSSRSGGLGGPVPLSQTQQSRVSSEAANATTGGQVVVNQQINVTTTGAMDDETILKIEDGQRRAASRFGRLRTG